jgi:hypothetical protein
MGPSDSKLVQVQAEVCIQSQQLHSAFSWVTRTLKSSLRCALVCSSTASGLPHVQVAIRCLGTTPSPGQPATETCVAVSLRIRPCWLSVHAGALPNLVLSCLSADPEGNNMCLQILTFKVLFYWGTAQPTVPTANTCSALRPDKLISTQQMLS